jgi:hypothetical protein
VGFQSPSMINYLEPLIEDLFTTQFAATIFYEKHLPALRGDFKHQKEYKEIKSNTQGVLGTDPRTTESEL